VVLPVADDGRASQKEREEAQRRTMPATGSIHGPAEHGGMLSKFYRRCTTAMWLVLAASYCHQAENLTLSACPLVPGIFVSSPQRPDASILRRAIFKRRGFRVPFFKA
jgi:hypothetical protein